MAPYGVLEGIVTELTKSPDHPSRGFRAVMSLGPHRTQVPNRKGRQ